MAVSAVSAIGGETLDGHREWTVNYDVEVSAKIGPKEAMAQAGVPGFGATYAFKNDTDPGAYFVGKRCQSVRDRKTWKLYRVQVQFSTKPRQQCDDQEIENPVDRPTVWSGSFFQSQGFAEKDNAGNAVASTAGEPFDPPPTVDDPFPSIVADKNFQNLNLDLWRKYRRAVNDAAFLGLEARSVRVSNISWQKVYDGQCDPYFAVRFEFLVHDEDLWDLEILDQGFLEVNAAGNLEHIKINGVRVNKPHPLDGFGGKLPQGDPFEYLKFRFYPEKDFSQLGLPTSI